MREKITKLIEKYESRCKRIIDDSTINGEFDYECDADDQVYTALAESEYNTLQEVICALKKIIS